MSKDAHMTLSRRERQIMDILYRRGQASVSEVLGDLPDPPSYSAVRALLGVLKRKGHVAYKQEDNRYIYRPTRAKTVAAKVAAKRLLTTFFQGSLEKAVAALLDGAGKDVSKDELDRVSDMVNKARKAGK